MPRARPARSAAPAEAASPGAVAQRRHAEHGRSGPRPTPAGPSRTPPSVTPSALEPPRRPTVTTSMTRSTSQATDSITARARSPAPCAAPSPMNPARASSRHHGRAGAVEPRHGDHAARTGRALAGQAGQLVGGAVEQAAQPGQERARRRTGRPRAASPRRRARVTTAPAGEGTGRSCTGTETLAVVPQLTIGWSSDAPEPSTSHWRSPAPMTTGMPGRSPSSAPGTGFSWPTTVSEATTLGSLPSAGPASSRTALPSKS